MTFNFVDYTITTSYLLFLLFLLFLVECQFVFKKVFSVGLIVVGYLMLLSVFNDINVAKEVILIILISIFLYWLIHSPILSLNLMLVVCFILLLIGGSSLMIQASQIDKAVLNATSSYRSKLTKEGFYEFIAQQGSEKFKITGFSEDDTRLGGSMVNDYTILFKVKQANPHYWKIDNKSYYTGTGWQKAEQETQNNSDFERELTFSSGSPYTSNTQEIELNLLYEEDYVPTTYGNLTISDAQKNMTFNINENSSRITMKDDRDNKELLMELSPLEYDPEDLESTYTKSPQSDINYLQLPENLPDSIHNLAKELTIDKETDYEKVSAIETYLKTSAHFRYSKEDTNYPEEDQDYVEDFLFESNVGYCDNFSTAMAVMLRTIGIPSRWAKGFSVGSIYGVEDGEDIYAIRNADAHSWVEVYFENYGWIPFEPTPSFNYPEKLQAETATMTSEYSQESSELVENESSREVIRQESSEQADSGSASDIVPINIDLFLKVIFMIILVFMCVCLYRYWLLGFIMFQLKRHTVDFTKIYPYLLRKAQKKLPRRKGQDLMSYSRKLEESFPVFKSDFSHLTRLYEEAIYGNTNDFTEDDKEIVKKVTRLLIKK